MNVFLADWAVGPGHFLHTLVGVLQVVGQTHVALVAVEILGATSDLKCSVHYKVLMWTVRAGG